MNIGWRNYGRRRGNNYEQSYFNKMNHTTSITQKHDFPTQMKKNTTDAMEKREEHNVKGENYHKVIYMIKL